MGTIVGKSTLEGILDDPDNSLDDLDTFITTSLAIEFVS